MRLTVAACLIASPAFAYEPSYVTAMDLGSVIGAEDACALSISEAGVAAYIAKSVDPAEMGFANSLASVTKSAKRMAAGMSETELLAHCEAVKRTAAHHGLLD